MRAENQNSKKAIVAICLSVLALLVVARQLSEYFGSLASADTQPIGVNRKTAKDKSLNSTDPTLHLAQLELSEHVAYNGIGRNIFQNLPDPEPKPTPRPPEKQRPAPALNATPSEIPLKFFGFATMVGFPRKVFLSANGDLFIGSEGDIVNRRYRIARVGATSIDVEDLMQQSTHILPLSIG